MVFCASSRHRTAERGQAVTGPLSAGVEAVATSAAVAVARPLVSSGVAAAARVSTSARLVPTWCSYRGTSGGPAAGVTRLSFNSNKATRVKAVAMAPRRPLPRRRLRRLLRRRLPILALLRSPRPPRPPRITYRTPRVRTSSPFRGAKRAKAAKKTCSSAGRARMAQCAS